MNRLTFLTSCAVFALTMTCALSGNAEKKKNVLDLKESISDNNIVYPEANYEAESRKMLEGWYMKNYMATDDRYMTKEDVNTSDDTYRRRLSELPTIIELPFNQVVKSHIERYTRKGRPMVAALLGLSNYYMPIFEQALEEKGLPLELKYLPVIESALDPNAVSRSGATGLWQFMLASGKGLGMEVNSLVDERRDPYVSSERAAQFLKDLYKAYGDWSLAIAAYNCGPGTVNKALRRAGGDPSQLDFWAIYSYLPEQTRGYVPAFIAANYVMNHYKDHNISPVVPKRPLVTDTLHVNKRIHFNQISKVLDIPVEELRMLNPQFRKDIIPGTPTRSYTLVLPSQQVHAYIMSEEDIVTFESEKYARRIDAEPGQVTGEAEVTETFIAATDPEESTIYQEMADAPTLRHEPQPEAAPKTTPAKRTTEKAQETPTLGPTTTKMKTHKVEPGESLSSISAKYGVSPEQLKRWNNLRRNSIRIGQTLYISGSDAPAKTESAASHSVAVKKENAAQARKRQTAEETSTPAKNSKSKATQASKNNAKATKETPSKKKGKAAAEPARPKEHTVQSGESYERIARKYGVTTEELKKANNATSDMIKPDQKLKIPKKTSAAASSSKKSSAASKTSSSSSKKSTKKSSKKKK